MPKKALRVFLIEYEIPPLRAIYYHEVIAETKEEAGVIFWGVVTRHARIRKLTTGQFI